MDISQAIKEFKETLASRGYPKDIVWLQGSQLWLTQKDFFIHIAGDFPCEKQVISAYNKLSSGLECGATLMLVTTYNDVSYGTLLLDSFGSDSDVEFDTNNFYLWCDPYIQNFKPVVSRLEWFWKTKVCRNYELSSLDYAFLLNKSN